MKKNAKKPVGKGKETLKTSVIVSGAIGNYEKHPFFVKKATEAKALINKVGLPKEFLLPK